VRAIVNVIYSETHALHSPATAFAHGEVVAHDEGPARAHSILKAVRRLRWPVTAPALVAPDALLSVHTPDYVDYLQHIWREWTDAGFPSEGAVPSTFPRRLDAPIPADPRGRAGSYGFDTETPVGERTFEAALAAAACALTGADMLLAGARSAYALCRPPGHHAGPGYCGGYCYLNNAALAARRLASNGRTAAVLDIDFHHGNGTQDVFYEAPDVLYASIHGDPRHAYPFFWGAAEETGAGPGEGLNLNLPLPLGSDDGAWLGALGRALGATDSFEPAYLVVSLGTDACAGDPVGGFRVTPDAFAQAARRIASLGVPTLVVQEGGYDQTSIGRSVTDFLQELASEQE